MRNAKNNCFLCAERSYKLKIYSTKKLLVNSSKKGEKNEHYAENTGGKKNFQNALNSQSSIHEGTRKQIYKEIYSLSRRTFDTFKIFRLFGDF